MRIEKNYSGEFMINRLGESENNISYTKGFIKKVNKFFRRDRLKFLSKFQSKAAIDGLS